MDTRQHRQQRYRFSLILLPAMALLLTISNFQPAAGQNPPPAPPPGHSPIDDQQILQLNPDQKAKFTNFETTSRAKKKELIDRVRDLRHQLFVVYQSYDLDVKKANDLNRELNSVQQELLKLHFTEQVELRKILTADQFNRLQTAIRQHIDAAKNDHWHGDHHGNPDWPH